MHHIQLYNSLSRRKEEFEPINPPFVGMYLCGPTVYGEPHLGHARPAITGDVVFRYLTHLGYKVRYVRNITDVGHLENDADEGEDKIAKKARLEQLEPMEVAHHYTDIYNRMLDELNVLSPSIVPFASGHIIEQIEMIRQIMDKGYAYEVDGSVYFDVERYSKDYPYGELSGRVVEELIAGAGNERRELEGQEEKHSKADFALWKKASPEHIMRWPSPWSEGFPGWHIECSAMSSKYLGVTFDIHLGGMDLLFPHHEAEIAQAKACSGHAPVKYWMHVNMLTIGGQKMGKSLNNFINLSQFFSGQHPLLEQPYTPMTIRFFMLQAHYRSTIDFSNPALQAAEKGFARLVQAYAILQRLKGGEKSTLNIQKWVQECYDVLDDDFNTPMLIAKLFEAVSWVHELNEGRQSLTEEDLALFREKCKVFVEDILGLKTDLETAVGEKIDGLMDLILSLRQAARKNKDFQTSDQIRDKLQEIGFTIKDTKEGTDWSLI